MQIFKYHAQPNYILMQTVQFHIEHFKYPKSLHPFGYSPVSDNSLSEYPYFTTNLKAIGASCYLSRGSP